MRRQRVFNEGIKGALAVLIATTMAGCRLWPWSRTTQPTPASQPNAALITQTVYTLMLCQECIGGEHRNVVDLGATAVPVLRDILVAGPPQAHVAQLTQDLSSQPPKPTRPPPSAAIIALQLEDFATMYRVRAAAALGDIGGVQAKQALCAGRATPALRRQVYDKIDNALARIGGTACP